MSPAVRAVAAALVLLVAACGGGGGASNGGGLGGGSTPGSLEELPEGSCGGFAALGESEPLALLGGRLRVRAPRGAADVVRPYSIMGAPPPVALESRLFLEQGSERFVVFAEELFRRSPGEDLAAVVRRDAGEGYRVAPLEVAPPLQAVVAVRDEPDYTDEAVDVALAYTVTPDGLVQRVGFYVTPEAARSGGCQRLGLSLARTLEAGSRALHFEPGPVVLAGTLGLELPGDHQVVVEEGPDFFVYRVFPVLPLGASGGALGIYEGHHAGFSPPEGATRRRATILGQRIEWFDWTEDDVHIRQALVPQAGGGMFHIFLSAGDGDLLDRLTDVASSLTTSARPRPLAACPDAVALPAVEAEAVVLAIPALRALGGATELSWHRQTWDGAGSELAAQFAELLAHPRARDAFRHLAVHGSTAGRLYGLAGLYLVDRDGFDDIACAVRSVIEPTVTIRKACGTEQRPTAELIEHRDGVRGEAHWGSAQWAQALYQHPADLRGGGLAWQLVLGAPEDGSIEDHAWLIGGEGYVPPLSTSDRTAERLEPFAPAPARPRLTAYTQNSGVCRTRADGRVACWGTTPISEMRGATLLPAFVRWPSAMAIDLGLGCLLDARGRRTCFALLEQALQARAEACATPVPPGPIVRRFDDGPWRALGNGWDVCGIREDGTLHCFANNTEYIPEWVELRGRGLGASYAIPIEGEVRGVARGHLFGVYAWTADGTIWAWDNDQRPHRVGRIEGIADITTGNDGGIAFARTGDGRVFARGVRGEEWWSSYGDDEGEWEEIPALRGIRVVQADHHGCALHPDGAVRCWGQHAGFAPVSQEPHHDRAPTDVPALRGAQALVLGDWVTCGVLREGELRCLGRQLRSITNLAVREEEGGPLVVRLDDIAARIR